MSREVRHPFLILLLGLVGCASVPTASIAKGPWAKVPTIEMPTGDTSIPIGLIRDTAEALLERPGAKVCDPQARRPIVGLSTEYCATVYVAGTHDALSWRVTEPTTGSHDSCLPASVVQDEDYSSTQVWVVGYIHNHPCSSLVSSRDLGAWPTDAFNPYVAMAEVRLVPGNPVPAVFRSAAIEMASALVAERQDGSRIFLRYFATGEIQQWSSARNAWLDLGRCRPREKTRFGSAPQCDAPLRLLHE